MDGRSATVAAIAVAAIGIVCFFLLDGVAAGLALAAAGILLVVIGLVGWQERRPRTALVPAGVMASAAADEGSLDDVSGIPVDDRDEPDDTPEPVAEEAPAPQQVVGGVEAVADPLGRGETDSVLDTEVSDDDPDPDRDYAPAPEPTMQVLGEGTGLDHVHDEPLLGHSDLVAHVRDYHEDLAQVGSTIQLRLLHERAHGAPHEPPVNLKTS